MADTTLMKIFSNETYEASSGGAFPAGRYRIDKLRWAKFDYKGKQPGKDGTGILTLAGELQPLDKDGAEMGESTQQYWGLGPNANDDFESRDKGKSLAYIGNHSPRIWDKSDCHMFMSSLLKAEGFDADQFEDENDLSVLDGVVVEISKVARPMNPNAKPTDKKYPDMVGVVSSVITPKKKAGKAGGKKEEDAAAEEKPAAGKKGKAASDDNDPADVIGEWLGTTLQPGAEALVTRIAFKKFLAGKFSDEDVRDGIFTYYKDSAKLKAVLKAVGWKLEGDVFAKA